MNTYGPGRNLKQWMVLTGKGGENGENGENIETNGDLSNPLLLW